MKLVVCLHTSHKGNLASQTRTSEVPEGEHVSSREVVLPHNFVSRVVALNAPFVNAALLFCFCSFLCSCGCVSALSTQFLSGQKFLLLSWSKCCGNCYIR